MGSAHFKGVTPSGKPTFVNLEFHDSIKMIPEPLHKFGKMFGLKQAKEVMPYDLYTEAFVKSVCQAATMRRSPAPLR